MNTTARWTLLGLLAAALAAGAAWAWHSQPARPGRPAAAVPPPPPKASANTLRFAAGAPQLTMLQTQPLQAVPLPLSAEPLSARVAYDEDATARVAVPISGHIVRLAVAPGQAVRAGQVLAEIDSPDVGTAVADLSKARADEARKRAAAERAQSLQAGEGIAARDAEAARADLEQARAETLRAQQRLANLNPRGLPLVGQRIALTSPLAGVVTERNATPGLEVAPGMATPLFVVSDPTRLWLWVDLPDELAGRVQLGSTLAVESDVMPGQRSSARVTQTGQLVDPNSRRITLRAALPNPTRRLLPEMFVRAWLLQSSGSAVRVPMSAVVDRGVHAYVFVQTAPREFERREVQLASRSADVGYVSAGLQGGELVVAAGALLLDAELADQAALAPAKDAAASPGARP